MNLILKLSLVAVSSLALAGCGSAAKKADANSGGTSHEAELPALDGDTADADMPTLKSGAEAKGTSTTIDPKYKPLAQAIRAGRSKLVTDEAAKLLGTNAYDPIALNALAVLHLKRGHPAATQLLLNKAIEKSPANAALFNNLGVALVQLGDEPGALVAFKKAIRADVGHRETLGNLGSLYMKGGDVTRALPLLEQSYKANRASLGTANNYAIALRMSGDLEGASKIYDEILKADPKNLNAMVNDAILLIDFMNKPKDGLTLVYKIKFLETDRKDVVARANALEKKAKAALQ